MSTAALAIAVCVTAILVACGGSSSRYGPQGGVIDSTPLVSPTPTSTPEPISAQDAAQVNVVIVALRTKDVVQIRPHVGFRKIGCAAEPNGPGAPPKCEDGERDGDQVDAFYYGTCEGQYLRPAEVDQALEILKRTDVYAAYRLAKRAGDLYQYAIVLEDSAPARDGYAWEAVVDNGEMIGLLFSCSLSPEDLVAARPYTGVVVAPP